jgi:hypothetical protein
MKSILAAIGVAFAVTLGAQSTPPAAPQAEAGQPSKATTATAKSAKPVTLTGCLREGTEPNTYLLANVDMTHMATMGTGAAPGSAPRPETGGATSGSATASGTAAGATSSATGGSTATGRTGSSSGPTDPSNSVKLLGNADLQAHVGHEVQVTGTMVPHGKGAMQGQATGTSGTTGSATGETTTDTTSRAGERSKAIGPTNMHTLHVQAVKMIGADCARK